MNLTIIHTVLLLLLCIAAYHDYRSYIISNILVVSGVLLGVILNSLLPSGIGFINSFAGMGVGLLLLLPLYLLRAMGAGDIKLMAMVGAFIGHQEVLTSIFYILITGGILAICVAIYRGTLKIVLYRTLSIPIRFIVNLFTSKPKYALNTSVSSKISHRNLVKIPYGIAIAIGTAIYLVVHQPAI